MRAGNIYDRKLQWVQRPDEFDRDEKAIILACSRVNHLWSTYGSIAKQSGLDSEVLYKELLNLLSNNILKIAFDENMEPVFSLRERLEK